MSTIETTTKALPTGTWNADPVHSHVGFAVEYVGGTFRGTFSPFNASLTVGDDGATLTGSAPVAGVNVQDDNLTAHLQSPDFFDAERPPELRFESTEITRDGGRVEVDGQITIRGETKPVHLAGTISDPADDPFGGVRFQLVLEGKLDRTQFGLNWNNPLPSGEPSLANDVELKAELYFVKA
jgi:polyisoprenoid-binding protein YceI